VNQEQSALVMLALMALALAGAWWGWRRRRNSYSDWAQHFSFWDGQEELTRRFDCLYVGTSEAGLPLQRVAVGPLSYRAKAELGLHPTGLVLRARGSKAIVLPAAGLRAGRATWTIDRTVEPDGLLMVQWILGPHVVESYFRLVDTDLGQMVDAINALSKERQA